MKSTSFSHRLPGCSTLVLQSCHDATSRSQQVSPECNTACQLKEKPRYDEQKATDQFSFAGEVPRNSKAIAAMKTCLAGKGEHWFKSPLCTSHFSNFAAGCSRHWTLVFSTLAPPWDPVASSCHGIQNRRQSVLEHPFEGIPASLI